MLQHGEAKVLLTDREFAGVIEQGAGDAGDRPAARDRRRRRRRTGGQAARRRVVRSLPGRRRPELRLAAARRRMGRDRAELHLGHDRQPEGRGHASPRRLPERGLATSSTWEMPQHPVYLWTLPMFHCNGWCFPWTMALQAGISVCLRKVDTALIFDADPRAPRDPPVRRADRLRHADQRPPRRSAPASTTPINGLIAGVGAAGRDHRRLRAHRHRHHARLRPDRVVRPGGGVRPAGRVGRAADRRAGAPERAARAWPTRCSSASPCSTRETMQPVPADGETIGEIFFRGNLLMKGYLKNPAATEEAFAGGWFHTGDLAVLHADGYVKIKDRSKDVIISGGENISSVEVEDVLYRHPVGAGGGRGRQARREVGRGGGGVRRAARAALRPPRPRSSNTAAPRWPASRCPSR